MGSFWFDPELSTYMSACGSLSNPSWPTEEFFYLPPESQIRELNNRADWIENEVIGSLSSEGGADIPAANRLYGQVGLAMIAEVSAIRGWADATRDFPSATEPFFDNFLKSYSERSDICLELLDLTVDYLEPKQ